MNWWLPFSDGLTITKLMKSSPAWPTNPGGHGMPVAPTLRGPSGEASGALAQAERYLSLAKARAPWATKVSGGLLVARDHQAFGYPQVIMVRFC